MIAWVCCFTAVCIDIKFDKQYILHDYEYVPLILQFE